MSKRPLPTANTSFGQDLIVRTRFIPPQTKPHLIARPHLEELLASIINYPLTLLKAEAGYGKTTTIATFLANSHLPHFWCNLGETMTDPLLYLLHIIYAFRERHPAIGEKALQILAHEGGASRLWMPAVDALVNDLLDTLDNPTVLVLDDYTAVNEAKINAITERLIEQMPPQLHVVITSRSMPSFPARARWRATGELLEIGRSELAFRPKEICRLFAQRGGHTLSLSLARALAAETEGWPIAIQMLSEGIRHMEAGVLDDLLRRMPGPLELLFDYLAEEVFGRQPEEIQVFLAETAVLRYLDPDTCNALLDRQDAEHILRYLEENSLFITREGTYRHHPLFRDFLNRRAALSENQQRELHRKAAEYYYQLGNTEEAVYHLLSGGQYRRAAELLVTIARPMAYSGRHQTLAAWLDQLPPELLGLHPELLLARGHAYRFASQYQQALATYEQARERFVEISDTSGEIRALRGQIQVYLDTVQPAQAAPLLAQALAKARRGNRRQRAELLLLLAENKLNAGNVRQAERLHRAVYQAANQTDFPAMNPRVYVRNGRIARARQLIETSLRTDPWGAGHWRVPRSHREATVLLAWLDALTGDANNARHYATQALELAQSLNSPIVESVSLARLGHAWLTGTDYDPAQAEGCYRKAMALAEKIGVPRYKVEAYLGFTLLAGLEGNVAEAKANTREALAILAEGGDRYMTALVQLALGAALTLSDHPETAEWLAYATESAQFCGDSLTLCQANLWQAVHHYRLGRWQEAATITEQVLQAAQTHGYDFLFTAVPLLGPKDYSLRLLLLEQIPPENPVSPYARRLRELIIPKVTHLPAYPASFTSPTSVPLYIQTLGPFTVRRSGRLIERSAWGRAKALHLLQFLVCRRGHFVHREQIMEALWSDTPPSTAATGLRVALSVLRKVLSPLPGTDEALEFIQRDGDSLRLDMSVGVYVDADEFMRRVSLARELMDESQEQAIELYESALAMYRGDFLEEQPYAEWAMKEREQLTAVYLAAAEQLTRLLLKQGEYERGMRWANTILAKDPLWEEGYVLLMQCHWKQGNRALAVRVYDRCRRRLYEGLGIEPSPRTTALFTEISGS